MIMFVQKEMLTRKTHPSPRPDPTSIDGKNDDMRTEIVAFTVVVENHRAQARARQGIGLVKQNLHVVFKEF